MPNLKKNDSLTDLHTQSSEYILAYVPVIHAGYMDFFAKHFSANKLYILDQDVINLFDHWQRKDIRALAPKKIKAALENLDLPFAIELASLTTLKQLNSPATTLIIPEEIEMQELAKQYLSQAKINWDSFFLRYDRSNSTKPKDPVAKTKISRAEFDQQVMQTITDLASQSSDWWRQVGAAIIKNKKFVLSGFNHHVPHEQSPYVNGDPRGNFHKGEYIELSTALHAEASLIAQAARQGQNLQDAQIYVTTFPCPNCAKLIAASGIKTVYFKEGYAMLDGQEVLESAGVEIVQVEN